MQRSGSCGLPSPSEHHIYLYWLPRSFAALCTGDLATRSACLEELFSRHRISSRWFGFRAHLRPWLWIRLLKIGCLHFRTPGKGGITSLFHQLDKDHNPTDEELERYWIICVLPHVCPSPLGNWKNLLPMSRDYNKKKNTWLVLVWILVIDLLAFLAWFVHFRLLTLAKLSNCDWVDPGASYEGADSDWSNSTHISSQISTI